MSDAPTFSTSEKRSCIERELRYRERVYPRLIERGQMTPQKASHELSLMRSILADYPAERELF